MDIQEENTNKGQDSQFEKVLNEQASEVFEPTENFDQNLENDVVEELEQISEYDEEIQTESTMLNDQVEATSKIDDAEIIGEILEDTVEVEIIEEDDLTELDEISEDFSFRSPYDKPGHWYVVHTYAGYEKKVKSNLETRRESLQMSDKIYEIVIPMEDTVEVKAGKKYTVSRKVFPSYILVRCDEDSEAFEVIRRTPGVTGFVGAGNTPSRLTKREVETILSVKESDEVKQKSRAKLIYEIGQTVRVKEGPFADFSGQIAEINEDQLKLQVLVNIFGRETPVELEFSQVAKL